MIYCISYISGNAARRSGYWEAKGPVRSPGPGEINSMVEGMQRSRQVREMLAVELMG